MNLSALWRSFVEGSLGKGTALALAAAALAAGLLAASALLVPLVRLLTRRDPEKVGASKLRRLRTAFRLTALSFAAFVYFRGTQPSSLGAGAGSLALIVFGGYAAFEILLLLFADYLPQVRGGTPASGFLKDILRAVAFVVLLVAGLKTSFPALDLGAILATSAVASIVIGLALQESLSNIFSGIMLSIDRPYKPADWIEVDGKEGKVLDANWRSVRILTREDDVIYVPNSAMAKANLVNFSAPTPLHLCRRKVGVEYAAQPNKVRAVLVAMMSHVEGILKEPPPDVHVLDYGDSAVIYEMRFWIDDHARRKRIESEVMRGVWYHLKRNGISIPSPILDVYLRREKAARRPEDLVALLGQVDILKPLREEELLMLADDLTAQLFGRGEVVCRQGEPGSTFYIIRTGTVAVLVRGEDGVEAELAQLKPGAYFGEMSLLTGEPRSSTCRALEDSELLCLDRESFTVLLRENPPIAQAMSDIIAARTVASREKLARERETKILQRSKEAPGSTRILERILTLFGLRR